MTTGSSLLSATPDHAAALVAEPAITPRVFGLPFAEETQEELVATLTADPSTIGANRLLVTANLDHIVTLRENAAFRDAYANAWRITADGTPVFLYARARGASVPTRVTGSDLFAALIERIRPADHRFFFLVSNRATGEGVRQILLAKGFAEDAVQIEVPPFGFENDGEYGERLAARIRSTRPTHLVLGVGAPKSEIWANQYAEKLGAMFVLCVGASIEYVTGDKPRAPRIVSKLGMEWFWRFACEPRRLFHRYFVRSWGFLSAVADDMRGLGLERHQSAAARRRT